MQIAVTTPNGHVGQHLVGMLIRSGLRPRLSARHPERLPEWMLREADVVEADSLDPDAVTRATEGVDAVYWVDPSVLSDDPLGEYAHATDSIVQAARRNDIPRVVFQSSIGAEKRHGVGEIDGLAATEQALDALDADVMHLRCGYFFTNLLLDIDAIRRGELLTVLPTDRPMSWVAPRDIAEVAALRLLNASWGGHHVQAVHGPCDLSWADVAAIVSEQLGRTVHARRVSDDDMWQRYLDAGMPPAMADAVLGMSTGLRDDFRPAQARTVATTTPTRLAGWVRDELLPQL